MFRIGMRYWSTIQLLPYVGFPLVINAVQHIHTAAVALTDGEK